MELKPQAQPQPYQEKSLSKMFGNVDRRRLPRQQPMARGRCRGSQEVRNLIKTTIGEREREIIHLYYGLDNEYLTWEDISRRSDGELLGLNHQYLPKIVGVFADVLSAGKDLASEETATRMINLLRQLQQTLPPSAMASTLSSLQPQQQLALQSVLSS
ncbi:putative importin beta family [Helianthus annuus]|nr:putative importin beta family [Helianthus annuus]